MTELLLLALAVALVLACGGFVAAEFAFVTVDRGVVDRAAEKGDRSAQGVQRALRSLSTQLSGAQVGITITNLAIGFLAEPAIARLIDGPLVAAGVPEQQVSGIAIGTGLVLATGVTMILGELVPKSLAMRYPERVALLTVTPLLCYYFLQPSQHATQPEPNAESKFYRTYRRAIGTAGLSEQVREYCAIAPGRPVTAARIERVEAEDARLDASLLKR